MFFGCFDCLPRFKNTGKIQARPASLGAPSHRAAGEIADDVAETIAEQHDGDRRDAELRRVFEEGPDDESGADTARTWNPNLVRTRDQRVKGIELASRIAKK